MQFQVSTQHERLHGHRLLGDSLSDHYRLAGGDEISENALRTRKSPRRPLPGRSTARYWAVQASKQSQSMHFQYTRSIHLWTTSTSTQLQITSMHMQPTSSSVNCFLPPEFARPPSLSTISKSFIPHNFLLVCFCMFRCYYPSLFIIYKSFISQTLCQPLFSIFQGLYKQRLML